MSEAKQILVNKEGKESSIAIEVQEYNHGEIFPRKLKLKKQAIRVSQKSKNVKQTFSIKFRDILSVKTREPPTPKQGSSNPALSLVIHTIDSNSAVIRKDFVFASDSPEQLSSFAQNVKQGLYDDPLSKRPKRLTIIINPIGGDGRAVEKYTKQAKPIFLLAEIQLTEIQTERSKHAQEIASKLDLSSTDGIVCVGGDGIVNEVLNGLMNRSDSKAAASIPIGIIPAGSQNALAVSSSGTADIRSHAASIAKGNYKLLDLVQIHLEKTNQFVYSSIFTSFGYLGDVTSDSTYYRWMGPARYIFCGAKRGFFDPQFYKIRISYIPADESGPKDKEISLKPTATDTWKTAEIDVFCFMACNISCANTQFPALCPDAELTDNCLSLVVWRKCSRVDMLTYMFKQKQGTHHELPFVDIFKVKALRFEPVGPGSPLDIDGEVFECSPLNFTILPSHITLYSS